MRRPLPAPRLQARARAGFSLFEIAVSMAILGLIAGAIFSILWQAGDTAVEIRELDRRDEEVSRFLALLRESIEDLPQGATLEMIPAEESTTGFPELKFGNSATAFLFGKIIGNAEEVVLSLRPSQTNNGEGPTYDLAITRPDFLPEDPSGAGFALRASTSDFLLTDEEGRYWLPLLTGITAASWSYWDETQQLWLDEWTDSSRLPPLLAFSLDDAYRPVPLRVVFEVPEQVSNPPSEADNASGTTGNSTGSTTGNAGRGEGGGRGNDAGPGGGGRPKGGPGGPNGARPGGGPGGGGPTGGGPGAGLPGGSNGPAGGGGPAKSGGGGRP